MCKKIPAILALTLLSGLVLIGSLRDYEIARALYLGQGIENPFGIVFSYLGAIPTFLGWSLMGATLLSLSLRQEKGTPGRRGTVALSVLLFLLSFFYFCNTLMLVNQGAFRVHWLVAYPIGIALIVGTALLGRALTGKSQDPHLKRQILILVAVSLLTLTLTSLLKRTMDRPRFRFLLEGDAPQLFRAWWQRGTAIKRALGPSAVSDDFSSFPSGHSSYAMLAVFLFPALGCYLPRLKSHRTLLASLGFLWWALTALSRLTVGAHFLTDVCIGGLVTLFSHGCVMLFLRLRQRRQSTSHNEKECY